MLSTPSSKSGLYASVLVIGGELTELNRLVRAGGAARKLGDVRVVAGGEKELPVALEGEAREERVRRSNRDADALRVELAEEVLAVRPVLGDVARLAEGPLPGREEIDVPLREEANIDVGVPAHVEAVDDRVGGLVEAGGDALASSRCRRRSGSRGARRAGAQSRHRPHGRRTSSRDSGVDVVVPVVLEAAPAPRHRAPGRRGGRPSPTSCRGTYRRAPR